MVSKLRLCGTRSKLFAVILPPRCYKKAKDETLEDSASLPAPDVLAQEIAENLRVALAEFSSIAEELEEAE